MFEKGAPPFFVVTPNAGIRVIDRPPRLWRYCHRSWLHQVCAQGSVADTVARIPSPSVVPFSRVSSVFPFYPYGRPWAQVTQFISFDTEDEAMGSTRDRIRFTLKGAVRTTTCITPQLSPFRFRPREKSSEAYLLTHQPGRHQRIFGSKTVRSLLTLGLGSFCCQTRVWA